MIDPPKMVLFDCDGVVVDSEVITNQVFRDDLAGRGLDLRLDQIMELFVGGTMSGAGQEAARLGADIPADWLDIIYPKIYAALEAEVEVVPGIVAVLDRLDARAIPYAMGSNGRVTKMQITLGRTRLLHRFEGRMYSAQDLGAPKPAPDVYLKAAADAGIEPSDCVVIEDSASGAKAAVAAKIRCFGYTADTPADRLAPHCDTVFDDMRDLPDLLGL
ncbi:HAD family hydrolase [Algirhabdus cladophorae]|uniref:HAD family hydrolase n=1 Tax=Algirhabdus cladophorae TaxID=3377108 RepID=UPI003B845B81